MSYTNSLDQLLDLLRQNTVKIELHRKPPKNDIRILTATLMEGVPTSTCPVDGYIDTSVEGITKVYVWDTKEFRWNTFRFENVQTADVV